MKEIQIFNSPQFGQIRVVGTPNEPLFRASDICLALGYSNPRDAIARHIDEDDVVKRDTIDNLGRTQQSTFINESGLYALIFGSKLESAKAFKRWVTSEVLPAIRKDGGYIAPMPDETPEQTIFRALSYSQETMTRQAEEIKLLKELNAERQRTIELQQLVIEERKTHPQLASSSTTPASYTTTRIGLEVGMTAHELNVCLHNAGVIEKIGPDWHVTTAYNGMGLSQPAVLSPNRKPGQIVREVWTEKGRQFIINLINQSK